MPLIVTFVIITVEGFTAQVGCEHGQQIRVTFALTSQGVRIGMTDGSVFATHQQIDMGNFRFRRRRALLQ